MCLFIEVFVFLFKIFWVRDEGALELMIVLDQFPMNMFRGQPASFSTEDASRQVAERAIAAAFDTELDDNGKLFLIPRTIRMSMRSLRMFEAKSATTRTY